jgi:DNA-binding CsgD family transcriptional regulator
VDEVLAWCGRLLREDWISRVPMRRAMIGTVESIARLRAGDAATALRRIREVFGAVPPPAWGIVAGLPLSIAIRAGTDLGDAHAARSYLAVPVPPAMLDTPFALPYLQALGHYHAAMGHPPSALTHSRSGLELMARWGVGEAATEKPWRAEPRCLFTADQQDPNGRQAPEEGVPEEGAKLTDAEERVAALAAAGNTNRQIAEHLFITVSTVEQHLTKIYRKLNVRSRSALQRHTS